MFYRLSTTNWRMLIRVMGWLLLIEAVFMLVPVVTALIYGEEDLYAFIYAIAITVGCGLFATVCVKPHRYDMGKREGFMLTALVWVVFSAFGMIPFMMSSLKLNVSDAFFESMSGFTTTGASVIDGASTQLSNAIHIWRALMQWIGGMGIILFTLAVLPMLNSSGGMQMFNAEVTGITHEKLRPRVSSTAKRLWLVYFLLTALLYGLYWLGPMDNFDSICHALSTMSTGGFSTHAESIGAWNTMYVKIVTTVFMFIGGVNFALIFKISTGQFGAAWKNETFRSYLLIIFAVFAVFVCSLTLNDEVPNTIENLTIDPLFQIVSLMSSTGYVIKGSENWGNTIFAISIVLMFFGACAGSTSGGAKIDRALLMWKNFRNELYRCIYPNHILSVNMNGRTMSPELVNKVGVFLGLYAVIIIIGGILLTVTGLSFDTAFFQSFSCVSNTGISSVSADSAASFLNVADPGKWILSLLMLTGRLEVFTVLVFFTPTFWRK